MELWAAGIALLIIAAGILVLILCRKKIHKGLRIVGVCVLGALFAAILGYIVLTFLFLDKLYVTPLNLLLVLVHPVRAIRKSPFLSKELAHQKLL